jgi:hypothetical protein
VTADFPSFRGTILGGWTAAAIGLVLVAAVLSAQPSDRPVSESNWSVKCFADPHAKPDCEVSVAITRADLGHHLGFIYRVDRNVFLAVGLPAPARVTASVDRRPPYDLAMCTGQACLLRGRIATSLRKEMERGFTLHLEFQGVVTEVSLSGVNRTMSEALGRLNSHQSASAGKAEAKAASEVWSGLSPWAKPQPAAGLP